MPYHNVNGINFIKFEKCDEFIMGPIPGDNNIVPEIEWARKVNITKEFWMQDTPVTTKQYYEFANEIGYNTDYTIEVWDGEDWRNGPNFTNINSRGDNFPVVGVSYIDAENYIKWFSNKYGIIARLPTEAEFEYAAKSGCNCKDSCKAALFAKNNNLDRQEGDVPLKAPREVKKGVRNCRGLYDMNTLIWQWCRDWFYYYDEKDVVDPHGPNEEPDYAPWKGEKWSPGKVIRGGSFSYPYYHSRCSNRHYSKVDDRNFNLGFRLVLEGMS